MSDEPYDVVTNGLGGRRQLHLPLLLVIAAVSFGLAVFAVISLAGGLSDKDDTLERAGMAGCERNNTVRAETNRQAQAFIHHNEATLIWAIEVRPVLRAADTPAGRRAYLATGDLIRAYRDVRNEYFRLPAVDCAQRSAKPSPTPTREPILP